MALADDVLQRLLKRAETAALKSSERAVQERFHKPELGYWRLPLDERDRCHERLRAAEKAGGVVLTWAGQGGDDRPLAMVRVQNLARLAEFLGVATVQRAAATAAGLLAPWVGHIPRVDEILHRWSMSKLVRGLSTSAAEDFADALRVLEALRARHGEDQVVRTLSVQLFGTSKRIEQLARHLDVLTSDALTAPARHWDEVFGALGLVKEPQPFLVAGTGELLLASGAPCPIARPFVGVSNKAVTGYRGSPAWLLTIENLTTFHGASQRLNGGGGLIVYTGGMPSPTWCEAYKRLLGSLPLPIPAYHWGDIDVGGFRIASHLKRQIEPERAFNPWLMTPAALAEGYTAVAVDDSVLHAMRRFAGSAGWADVADGLTAVCVEQESVALQLPEVD
jgi:hypothetical protein